MSANLTAELLEARDTPASIGLGADGVLQVRADAAGSAVLTVWQDQAGVYNAYFDDRGPGGPQVYQFETLTGIDFVGGAGDDVFFNATGLSDSADLGAGDDYYIGGSGEVSVVRGGDGNDVLLLRADLVTFDSGAGEDRVLVF